MALEYTEEEIQTNLTILASLFDTGTRQNPVPAKAKLTDKQVYQIKEHMKIYKKLLKWTRASHLVVISSFRQPQHTFTLFQFMESEDSWGDSDGLWVRKNKFWSFLGNYNKKNKIRSQRKNQSTQMITLRYQPPPPPPLSLYFILYTYRTHTPYSTYSFQFLCLKNETFTILRKPISLPNLIPGPPNAQPDQFQGPRKRTRRHECFLYFYSSPIFLPPILPKPPTSPFTPT